MLDTVEEADDEALVATASLLQLALQPHNAAELSHSNLVLLMALLSITVAALVLGLTLQGPNDTDSADGERAQPSLLTRFKTSLLGSSTGTSDGLELEEVSLDFPENIYGAAGFAIICSGQAVDPTIFRLTRPQRLLRSCLCGVLLLGNYGIQIGLLFLASHYVVTPTIAGAQHIYASFHQKCFSKQGVFDPLAFTHWPQRADLCNLVFTFTWFDYVILVVWFLSMGNELRESMHLMNVFLNLEAVDSTSKQVEKDSAGTPRIMGLTTFTRSMLLTVIMLPKICISLVLFFEGMQWLLSTTGLVDVLINVVALEFIIGVDEILFASLVPRSIKADVHRTKIRFFQPQRDDNMEYLMAILFIVVITMLPLFVLTWGQELPGVRIFPGFVRGEVVGACRSYLERDRQKLCVAGRNCFPYGGR